SYVLYHYDVNRPKDDRPLDTLGKVQWQLGPVKTDGDTHSISFFTDIQGVRVTKTYSLAKREYHVGLEVKLERAPGTTRKDLKFRYQFSGAHQMPIEGRWYTSIFREALIGVVEKNDLWRNFQDAREIALKLGGDSVTRDEGRSIRYAAVRVQYFASAIVVDDEQDRKDFLASARPTLEGRVIKVEMEEDFSPGEDRLTLRDKKDRSRPAETYYLSPRVRTELAARRPQKGARFGLYCVPDNHDRLVAVRVLSEAETQPLFLDDLTVRV